MSPLHPRPTPSAESTSSLAPRRGSDRTWTLLLGVLLVVAAALRIWYASGFLDIHRFEDEQYSLQNVRKIYHTGDFEPASGYYPSPIFNYPQVLALRASEWLAEQTGLESLDAVGDNGRLLPTGVLLTRLYQTVCGVLTLWLAFLVGRRLFSPPDPRIGFLAALTLAFLPWAIHSSGYNKPDALLVMGVVAAFWASLRAIDHGRPADYVLAGLAIAIAMGGKLTGGLAAVPITVGTLFFWRQPRRLALLALAGLVSAVAFVSTNPYWRAYLHFIRGLQADYSGRTDASRWQVPLDAARLHLGPTAFGPLLGGLALLGLVILAAWLVRGLVRRFRANVDRDSVDRDSVDRDSVDRDSAGADALEPVRLAMFLAFPILYTLVYSLQTTYFKPNNFLPLLPFSAIALAWLVVSAWDWLWKLGGRSPRSAGRSSKPRQLVAGLAWLLVAALAVPGGVSYVYRSLVPTTLDLARNWMALQLQPRDGRMVYQDNWSSPGIEWEGASWSRSALSAWVQLDDISTVPVELLRLADGLILRRGHGERDAEWTEALVGDGTWAAREDIEPRLFRLRGPALVATLGAWQRHPKAPVTSTPCGVGCWSAPLPADETASVFALLPRLREGQSGPTLELVQAGVGRQGQPGAAGTDEIDSAKPSPERLPMRWVSRQPLGDLWVSPRVHAAAGGRAILRTVEDPSGGTKVPPIEVHRWYRPDSDSGASGASGASGD